MSKGEKTIAIVIPIVAALIGGIFTLIPDEPKNNPTAVISGSEKVSIDNSIIFKADESSDPDGSIEKYQWSVNGTSIHEQLFLNYTFTAEGFYQIDLVVIDDEGLQGKDTMVVEVSDEPGTLSNIKHNSGSGSCSYKDRWCYDFSNIDLPKKTQNSQNEVKIDFEIDASGSNQDGQVDVFLTVIGPDFEESKSISQMNTVKGEPNSAFFYIHLSNTGHYSLFFELTPPNKFENHVYDEHTIDFDFKK